MKIHELWAENVRGISSRVNLPLSPNGLNLVIALNEMGKTTMAQVLDFIFLHKSKSSKQEIKDLKPYGKDVGPLMGAKIEVNGQIYKIEKRWLKDEKTEVELLEPVKKALSDHDADKMIDKIFKEFLDETIWKMIQVAQANYSELLEVGFDDKRRSALSKYLAQAVVETQGFDDSDLVDTVKDHYLDWWQSKNMKLTTAKGTSGAKIEETNEKIDKLKNRKSDLEDKIAAADNVGQEMVIEQESLEILQNRKKAQDANNELIAAQFELKNRTDMQKSIAQLLADNPGIAAFSSELFDALEEDHALYLQYNALSSIKLTALADLNFEINGSATALGHGEIREQKLESPLNITIPNILSIDYQSDEASATGLEEGAKRFVENLKKIGCESFSAAQVLNRKYDEYQSLITNRDSLLSTKTIESLQGEINKNEAIKASFPNWDVDIEAAPVTEADLTEVAQQVGRIEGRSEAISSNGWYTDLEEIKEEIAELEKRLAVLDYKAQAARMLYEILEHHRSSAEKDYSIQFAKYINDLATSFHGEHVHFEVSDSFEILSRRMGSTEIDVSNLSTGAKEQLAILIRLALTQIVQVGEPFPVILDDEFAHSDPERIAMMMNNVFSDFAAEQQFIMFTCDPDRFASYTPAKTIDLAALRGA